MLLYTLSRQSRSGKLLGFSLALLFFFGLSQCAIWAQLPAQQKAATQQEPAKDTATADRGRKLFEQSCGFCIGAMAESTGLFEQLGYRHCRSGTQAVRTILWILPWPRCHW